MARKDPAIKTNKTLRLDKNDSLIQITTKNMNYGTIMFADPSVLVIKKNGDCWIDPNGRVFPTPDTIQDRVS